MNFFKTIFEKALIQHGNSKKAAKFYQGFLRVNGKNEINRNLYYAGMMFSWFHQEPRNRKIYRITSEGRDLTELFRSLNDIDLNGYVKEYEKRYGKIAEAMEDSFVIEFEKPVDMNFLTKDNIVEIRDERAKDKLYVSELMVVMESGFLAAPDPNNDQTIMLMLISDYFTKLFCYFKLDKFSVVTTEKEGVVKYDITKKLSKPTTSKWRYQDLTVTRKVYEKTKTSRPFSYEGKEEVVKVRKSHYRRLRNGEVRFFVGIEARYYVKKDQPIHGNIITI